MKVNEDYQNQAINDYQDKSLKQAIINKDIGQAAQYQIIKRSLDFCLSLLAIILLSPLFLLIFILLKMGDIHGPVIYSQIRIGKNGQPFKLYKFRSMVVGAETKLKHNPKLYEEYVHNNYKLKPEDDPRITKVGRLLRKTSIDEMPQFFNVLKGDMSLVGPRPVVKAELKQYDQTKLLSVKPGAMGLWQASGRSEIGYPERARIEEYYVTHACLKLDLKILIDNLIKIFNHKGAY